MDLAIARRLRARPVLPPNREPVSLRRRRLGHDAHHKGNSSPATEPRPSAFANPDTFNEVRHIVVKDGAKTIDQLNELEYIKGEIYANIWHSDRIARISPTDGHIIAWIDCTGLLPDDQKDQCGVRPERHRLRRKERSHLRYRKAVANDLRDKSHPKIKVAPCYSFKRTPELPICAAQPKSPLHFSPQPHSRCSPAAKNPRCSAVSTRTTRSSTTVSAPILPADRQGIQQQRPDGHGGFIPVIIPYHYYYGGWGGYGLGTLVGGGGYAPVAGRSYANRSGVTHPRRLRPLVLRSAAAIVAAVKAAVTVAQANKA